jgi:hypothetical protein
MASPDDAEQQEPRHHSEATDRSSPSTGEDNDQNTFVIAILPQEEHHESSTQHHLFLHPVPVGGPITQNELLIPLIPIDPQHFHHQMPEITDLRCTFTGVVPVNSRIVVNLDVYRVLEGAASWMNNRMGSRLIDSSGGFSLNVNKRSKPLPDGLLIYNHYVVAFDGFQCSFRFSKFEHPSQGHFARVYDWSNSVLKANGRGVWWMRIRGTVETDKDPITTFPVVELNIQAKFKCLVDLPGFPSSDINDPAQ